MMDYYCIEAIMWEHERSTFTRKISTFINESSVYPDFLNYFNMIASQVFDLGGAHGLPG